MPTLLLVGRHDTIRVDDVEAMAASMPKAKLSECDNGSYFSMWDDPAAYHSALLQFISEVREPPRANVA